MWDKLWGYIKQVISVGRRLDDVEEDITEFREKRQEDRQEDRDRDDKIDVIASVLQRVVFDIERDREKAESEREMQRLRLENLLLQAGNRLPPGHTPPNSENEAWRETAERLQRENEDLRKRLEALEQK